MKTKNGKTSKRRSISIEISEYLRLFRKDCELRGMTHQSVLTYISAVRIFLDYLRTKNIRVADVDTHLLKEYVGHLQSKNLTYKSLGYSFTAISALFELLMFDGRISLNPVLEVRKRYLKRYKNGEGFKDEKRKLITVKEMKALVKSAHSTRDRAILMVLAKTGVRRGELIRMDADDVDIDACSIKLKPAAKRSNRLVFFDKETKTCLLKWFGARKRLAKPNSQALFISNYGRRVNRNKIYEIVIENATNAGLHDPLSDKLEDRFTPHCCRHWFTTHLMRSGMPREHVQELRGDARSDAVDIYYHIDPEDLRRSYLKHIPKLGL